MSIEKQSSVSKKATRIVETNYGVTGIRLNLSLLHMFHLAQVREETKRQLENMKPENQAQYLLTETLRVLDFIVQDFSYPNDPSLWKVEEAE